MPDSWGFWDYTGSRVWTQGHADWYRSSLVYASGTLNNAWVYQAYSGCLWLKVTWFTASGSVSWPPSGTVNRTTDGWLRRCQAPGTWFNFSGVNHPSSLTLYAVSVCVGYSPSYSPGLRKYEACTKKNAGFN